MFLPIYRSRIKDGKILEVNNSSDRKVQNKEIIIPIQVSVKIIIICTMYIIK